ncbi:MAG: alpha/beta hydrolase [Clostridiales bacterium]|nr:alpha/beta hydrolase [Clostridiales bacterium]
MRCFTLNIRERASMDLYFLEGAKKRPLVIVVPGGGYVTVCDEEKTAIKYNAAGYHAAVLRYSVAPDLFPEALFDLAEAVAAVRNNSDTWKTDKVFLCGFSAGGHLCANLATLWNRSSLFGDRQDIRPDGCILMSAVLTKKLDHCRDFLDKLAVKDGYKDLVACDMMVNEGTPPAFMCGTYEDSLGNFRNSFYYAEALGKYNIPFELHIFPKGEHGAPQYDDTIWSLPPDRKPVQRGYRMIDLSVEWINEMCYNI